MTRHNLYHTLWDTMGARTATFRLVDLQTGGLLEQILAERRCNWGESPEHIARFLAAHYQAEVSGETVRRWCRDLGIKKEGAGA